VHLEHLFQPADMAFGFRQVMLEGVLQLRVRRLLDHFRQVFDDLVFRIVDVLQRVDKQVIQCLDRCGEQTHGDLLHLRCIVGRESPGP